MRKKIMLSIIVLGAVALVAFTVNQVANATPELLNVKIPMSVEIHSGEDECIPENSIIQFELEEMKELEGITDTKHEGLYRVTSFENFSIGTLTFNFGGFDFSQAGIYEYRVTQVLHDDMTEKENWDLDLVSFHITITVTEIDGTLTPDISIMRVDDNELTAVSEVRFTNTYRLK